MLDFTDTLTQCAAKSALGYIKVFSIVAALCLSGCMADPYEQCMKDEKRKNAYLGEDDYIKQSSKICARKARQSS